jgi:hypothetical protein
MNEILEIANGNEAVSHACVYKWFKRPTEGYHGLEDDTRSRQISTAQSRNSSQCEMAAE